MLNIYPRHTKACLAKLAALTPPPTQEQLRNWRECGCPKWYSGSYEGRWRPRTSLGTGDWDEAENELDKIKRSITQGQSPKSDKITLEYALGEWLKELAVKRVNQSTAFQWESLGKRLAEYCRRQGVVNLKDVDAQVINGWRGEWLREQTRRSRVPGIRRSTEMNRLTVLGHFFGFTRRMRWIPENPMDLISVSKKREEEDETDGATLPLDLEGDANWRKLLKAIPGHFASRKRNGVMSTRPEHFRAIVELMYHTGLRVSDAILFEADKARMIPGREWAEYTTRQKKTRKLVTVWIPGELVRRIQGLTPISAPYVFYDGSDMNSYNTGQIWCHLRDLGEAIGVDGLHPHRLRDSFAVNRLNEDSSIQEVSKMLGHKSIATTERYYAPFVKSRKEALMQARIGAQDAPQGGKVVAIKRRRTG